MTALLLKFIKDRSGSPTVEFVIIFPILIFLVLYIFLVGVDYFTLLSARKGVEVAAREAAVHRPLAPQLIDPLTQRVVLNPIPVGGDAGAPCYVLGNCGPIPAATCTYSGSSCSCTSGATTETCSTAGFNEIFKAVEEFGRGTSAPTDLTVRYIPSDLGYAGEPYIPLVVVELDDRASYLSSGWITFLFSGSGGVRPPVQATSIGENMNNILP